MLQKQNIIGILFYVFLVMLVFIKISSGYSFAHIARFETGIKTVMKNSTLFTVLNVCNSMILFIAWCCAVFSLL